MDDKKVTGASYLIGFFRDVQNLTHHNAQYVNILLELENRYASVELDKMEENHKAALIQWTQNLRYYAYKCYISYKSISENLGLEQKDKDAIEKQYKAIKEHFTIQRDQIEAYVISFNKILVKEADLKALLESSEEYINSVFNSNEQQTEGGNGGL